MRSKVPTRIRGQLGHRFAGLSLSSDNRLFARLDTLEIPIVKRLAAARARPVIRWSLIAVNLLADGWVYGLLGAALLALGDHGLITAVAAGMAIAGAHAAYPILKRMIARPRPFDRDPSLGDLLRPLDRFSCPSGHSMTATAAFIPIYQGYPAIGPLLFAVWLLIGWARLALGHHYPSDLVLGAFVGAAAAAPVVLFFPV